jgi:NAD(P)-dependent dehydrogenase (short-subunit alcohol dehydrogenase family)
MSTGHLRGRSAVVTGSSRGIGREVARALAAEGASVVVNGRAGEGTGAAAADGVVRAIRERGGTAISCLGSVADFEFAGELVGTCVDAFGGIDILVNCAGVPEPEGSSILDVSPEAWRELIDVHLTGTFHCCRHAAPRMVEQKRGSIVNTSSHSFLGVYGGTGYPAAKGATNSLTFALAAELREHGVRVNAVCPGAKTRLSTGPAHQRRIHDLHARGILGDALRDASLDPPDPSFVGPVYAFLASDLAEGITGRLFSAFGGYLGVFAPGRESPLAHRDHRSEGPWSLEELADRVRGSSAL